MGLLDGDIAALFGEVFGSFYLDGQIITALTEPQYDDEGTITDYDGRAPVACKVQIDSASYAMRQAEGFVEGDVRLLVLRSGVSIELSTDQQIRTQGKTWLIQSVDTDPAASHWICRARSAA